MISGIYEIVNKTNGKRYIGSSVNISSRWRQHLYLLRKGQHHGKHLQSAWNKYGSDNFEFTVLEECDICDLISVDQSYLDKAFPEYNTNKSASSLLGFRHSEESKKEMSIIHTGFRHTEESKKKMSEIWSGKPRGKYSEERIKKMSECRIGSVPSENQRLALDIGRRRSPTEDERRRISESQKGYKPTEETIQKLKDAWVRRKARAESNA